MFPIARQQKLGRVVIGWYTMIFNVMVTYVGIAGKENVRFAFSRGRWGLSRIRKDARFDFPVGLIISDAKYPSGKGVSRPAADRWDPTQVTVTLNVIERTGEVHQGEEPFWPNEEADNEIYYPNRFDMMPIGRVDGILVSKLPKTLHEAIRLRIASGCADTVRLSKEDLTFVIGLADPSGAALKRLV